MPILRGDVCNDVFRYQVVCRWIGMQLVGVNLIDARCPVLPEKNITDQMDTNTRCHKSFYSFIKDSVTQIAPQQNMKFCFSTIL